MWGCVLPSIAYLASGNQLQSGTPMPSLFDPLQIGDMTVKNRIIMAPLTRGRADAGFLPSDLMRLYYEQRATAGLIISEATGVSQEGLGWPSAPGLWTAAQVEAWKPVTDAVHAAGGKIIAQLWHMGRLVHSSFNEGRPGVSASATTGPGHAHTYQGRQALEAARPLRLDEMPRVVGDYAAAARNAVSAGFDGVQIHSANGYLLDQFLRDNANLRDDDYGGTITNRMRLLQEVTEGVCAEVGRGRVGVRLSPNGDSQGVDDSQPEALFSAVAAMLNGIGIAHLELREPDGLGTFGSTDVPRLSPVIRKHFKGVLITNSDRTMAEAQAELDCGVADAVSFGRPFMANPDLPRRFAEGIELNILGEVKSWYSPGPEGYTDYPFAVA
jgi:N-ethylmaleimide reductase